MSPRRVVTLASRWHVGVVSRRYLAWAAVWLLTRGFMLVQAGFWNDAHGPQLQDVYVFRAWSEQLASTHAMPLDDGWQYPPLVAFLLLLPRIGGAPYGESFVGLMLLVDLIGLVLLVVLARREQRDAGVWAWLLLMPCLGAIPLLRFDLVPTVVAVAALVAIRMRAFWLGVLVGAGALLKLWPAVVLLAEWDRRRLLRALAGVVAVVAVTLAAATIVFGDQSGFLDNQQQRGLQIEAVLATPWQLRQTITGEPVATVFRNGTNELSGSLADTLAGLLRWLSLLIGLVALAWWIARERLIRRGVGGYLATLAAGRDAVFAAVLLSVVASGVLSPQFMIWLVGLLAVVLCSRDSRLTRPALVVAAAVVMTLGLYDRTTELELSQVVPTTLVLRNALLLIASVDAVTILTRALLAARGVRGG